MDKNLMRSVMLGLAVALSGCQEEEPAPIGEPAATASAPTFYANVAPILQEKCVGCHQEGGAGPFRLDAYDSAKRYGLQAAAATRAGIMPPYLLTHDGSCGDFQDQETLTEAEKATIWDWANNGMKAGTPVSLPARPRLSLEGEAIEWKTPTIVPRADGGELAEFDEYRCFSLDSELDKDTFITGYEVIPGNAALVHHVVAFMIDPTRMTQSGKTNAEMIAALDQADPDRPGWTCYGAAGDGVEVDSAPVVWAPGQGPVVYPDGLGVPMVASHKLVVQVHYNLAHHAAHGMTDSTTVRFRKADKVDRVGLFITADGFLESLFIENGPKLSLPAGQKSTTFNWSTTGKQMGFDATIPYLDVIGIMPHMHERGVSMRVNLGAEGGNMACAANVPRWDFHWQKLYYYEGERPRLSATSRLETICEYDTSKDTSPVLPGWGTRNEMCAAIMLVALPPM